MELQGLLDSKKEYIEHLCDTFAEPMVGFFQRLYNDSLDRPEARGKSVLAFFQEQLGSITEWNLSKISEEYRIAKKRSGCHYINDLIKAILVTYVKIAILSNSSSTDSSKVKLRVPAAENFYHRCIIICAREIWKQPYLLYHKVRSIEIQRNLNELESIARKAIRSAVRMYIPLDQLVRDISLEPTRLTTEQVSDSSSSESDDETDSCEPEKLEDIVEEEPQSEDEEIDDSEVPQQQDESEEEDDPEVPQQEDESEEDENDNQQEAEAKEDQPLHEEDTVDDEADEPERRSIEIESMPSIVQHTTSCDVNKIESDDIEPVQHEEGKKRKIILGSMLINRGRHKLINTTRPPKADAFF